MNKSRKNKRTKKIKNKEQKNRVKRTKKNRVKRTKKNRDKRTKKNRDKRTKKNRDKRTKNKLNDIGGVKVFTLDGEFTIDQEILHEGKEFFKKMSNRPGELEICKILMEHPYKNIIKIYGVGKDYIDMELLNIDMDIQDKNKIKIVMIEVKNYLQSLGIMYIDWKLDNIGISDDGEIKLFDFNASGLIDNETGEWIIRPLEWWSYNEAIQHGMETPIDIDNYAFDIEFNKKMYD
jgi:hypothetical protein